MEVIVEMDLFEPIGEALIINEFTVHNSEIQLYLYVFYSIFVLYILSLCHK